MNVGILITSTFLFFSAVVMAAPATISSSKMCTTNLMTLQITSSNNKTYTNIQSKDAALSLPAHIQPTIIPNINGVTYQYASKEGRMAVQFKNDNTCTIVIDAAGFVMTYNGSST